MDSVLSQEHAATIRDWILTTHASYALVLAGPFCCGRTVTARAIAQILGQELVNSASNNSLAGISTRAAEGGLIYLDHPRNCFRTGTNLRWFLGKCVHDGGFETRALHQDEVTQFVTFNGYILIEVDDMADVPVDLARRCLFIELPVPEETRDEEEIIPLIVADIGLNVASVPLDSPRRRALLEAIESVPPLARMELPDGRFWLARDSASIVEAVIKCLEAGQ